jgi:peroxiredoxin Q/BCP
MAVLTTGSKAPSFKLPADNGETLSLKDFAGKKLVLYFYPKDDTSGCTAQACAFNDALPAFKKLKTAVLGVSKDPVTKHVKFRDKYGLSFPLLSDEEGGVLEKYGVWIEKSMYGRKYMGIERSTFIIDEAGKISHVWRKVKVPGHVDEVMKALKEE